MSHLLRVQLNGLIKELGIAVVVMLDVPQVLYQQRIGAIPVQLASLLSAGSRGYPPGYEANCRP